MEEKGQTRRIDPRAFRSARLAWVAVVASLVACGGGGGGDAPAPWSGVTIEQPTEAETYSTAAVQASLAGRAFIPDGSVCDAAIGTVAAGYRIRWRNAATGAAGDAQMQLNCLLQPSLTWEVPAVALAVGTNTVTVTATSASGESGSDAIAITRTP